MWSIMRHFKSTRCTKIYGIYRRLFMTDSFYCHDSWNDRFKSPILQKVSVDDFFNELDYKFNQCGRVSAIDIDIFVNAQKNGDLLDEMEDLIHKLRLSSESSNILDSTHYAFIKCFLDNGKSNELMRILNDRLNYGIFPDKFCYLLLMDYYIKKRDFCNAAKVASLQMLQEDFSQDLLKYLALYSCHQYLLNPSEWDSEEIDPESKDKDEDEEEIKVRVKYLRNPYFDDHFDLRHPDQLIGKTLLMISESIDDSLVPNYKLIGLILRNDPDTEKYILDHLKNNNICYLDIIELADKIVVKKLEDCKNSEENSVSDLERIKNGLKLIKEGNNINNGKILDVVEDHIKKLVVLHEKPLIEEQLQLYEDWENEREEKLKNELETLKRKLLLEQIEEKKEELKRKEDELFFFDKEDELDLKIEKKKLPQPNENEKKKKLTSPQDYVPPEITKKRKSL